MQGSVQGTVSPISAASNSNVTTRRSNSRQTSITQTALSVAHFVTTTTMRLGGQVASPTPSVTGDPPSVCC